MELGKSVYISLNNSIYDSLRVILFKSIGKSVSDSVWALVINLLTFLIFDSFDSINSLIWN